MWPVGPLYLLNIAAFLGQVYEMWADAFSCPSHPQKGHSRKSRGFWVEFDLTTSWLCDFDEKTLCPLCLCVLVCEMELIAPTAWTAGRTERDDVAEVLGQLPAHGR